MSEYAKGLTTDEVLALRLRHGNNVLTPLARKPWWKLYLEKFEDPIVRILMIAAGVAIGVGAIDGRYAEGVGILIAIFLATFLAFWNEHRAAKEFELLSTSDDDLLVKVYRNGEYTTVPRRDVVVGDWVILEVGEEVPADGTVTEAVGLDVNEAKLTGEAIPVEKEPTTENKLFRGTTVVDGYGAMVVTAVGDSSEIGKTLRESLIENDEETPLNKQLAKLSQIIGVVGFGIAVVVFAALLIRGVSVGTLQLSTSEWIVLAGLFTAVTIGGVNIWMPILYDALEILGRNAKTPTWLGGKTVAVSLAASAIFAVVYMTIVIQANLVPTATNEWLTLVHTRELLRNFMIAVTIIVVAVPEGLAMSVTLSIAYSIRKMTRTNTLVRRMAACETIGAATVICTDKTGTLTQNLMRVAEVELAPSAKLHEAIAANTTAQLSGTEAIGNPTEGALLLWLQSQGADYLAVRNAFPIKAQWTFNTERKFMATLGPVLHVKGAPEIILAKCAYLATESEPAPLTDTQRQHLTASIQQFQARGLRTLALAYRICDTTGEDEVETLAKDMVWLGVFGIADPIRADVPGAIEACLNAGVKIKIITGDNAEMAKEIARQIGMPEGGITVTGTEFAKWTDDEVKAKADSISILARARPADKLRLVRMLKETGEVVAVTGDGVNDGPALNFADVGLAMGKSGTAVAREASDIILLDDSFPSIVSAIRWGRSLYENIQRFILFQLTINVVALALAVLGPFVGFELPLTVMQMLWVNLIMDTFAALALATEPPHEGVLNRKPRPPAQFIVTNAMAKSIFLTGGVFLAVLVGFILFWPGREELVLSDLPSRSGTILFTVFVLLQFWNLFNAKVMGRVDSVFATLGNNPSFLLIALAILLGQVFIVQFGGVVFRTVPLSLTDWLLLLVSTSTVLGLGEINRLIQRGQLNRKKAS